MILTVLEDFKVQKRSLHVTMANNTFSPLLVDQNISVSVELRHTSFFPSPPSEEHLILLI